MSAEVAERLVDTAVDGKPGVIRASATRMDDGRWDPGCVVDVEIDEAASESQHLSFSDYPFYTSASEALDAAEAAGRGWAGARHD